MAVKRTKFDSIFSDLVRLRTEYTCENCGYCTGGKALDMHCAHIISRTYKLTRYHPDNAMTLCARCHDYYGKHPVQFGDFVREKQGDEMPDIIREIAHSKRKVIKLEWEDLYQDYRKQYKEMLKKRDAGETGRIDFIYPL